MTKPVFLPVLTALAAFGLAALGLAACDALGGGESEPRGAAAPAAVSDPVVARALYDPLMSDPDLARRSKANAAIAFADSRALPVLEGGPEASQRARDAARRELLAGGAVPALTALTPGAGGKALGALAGAGDILTALGAPPACRSAAREGFEWAARLTAPALIAPLGAVEAAAGSDAAPCRLRVVRYLTAAPADDALAFHDALAQRAGLGVKRYAKPEAMLVASGKAGEALRVHVRDHPGGMSAVDLVFWITP